jgi:hypothetical protein
VQRALILLLLLSECLFSELTENKRQKDDRPYAEMMDRCRIGSPTDDDLRAFMSRFISIVSGKGIHRNTVRCANYIGPLHV